MAAKKHSHHFVFPKAYISESYDKQATENTQKLSTLIGSCLIMYNYRKRSGPTGNAGITLPISIHFTDAIRGVLLKLFDQHRKRQSSHDSSRGLRPCPGCNIPVVLDSIRLETFVQLRRMSKTHVLS